MRMKVIAVLLLFSLIACEGDLQVYTDDFKPTPVVYFLLNPIDTVHTIRLSKSIGAFISPDEQVSNPDALVFDEAFLTVTLYANSGDTVIIHPQKAEECDKKPGIFGDDTHSLYYFTKEMTINYISLFYKVDLTIEIPGYPTVRGTTDILIRPRIRFPYIHAMYLFVDPTRPVLVQWYGAAWNEVDIEFTVMEQYQDSTVAQSFIFEERSNILMKEGVCEVKFPYDLIIQNLVRTLDPRKNVIRRYFGPIIIQVHTGNEEYAFYQETKDGINDFSGQTISKVENAIGLVGCKLSYKFKPLYFDYFTRQRFMEEPALEGLKFREF